MPRVEFGYRDCRPLALEVHDFRPASDNRIAAFRADVLMSCRREVIAGRVCLECKLPPGSAATAPYKSRRQKALEHLDWLAGGAITFADVNRLCPVPRRAKSSVCLRTQLHTTGEVIATDSTIEGAPFTGSSLSFRDDSGALYRFRQPEQAPFTSGRVYSLDPKMDYDERLLRLPRVQLRNCNQAVVEKLRVNSWHTEIEPNQLVHRMDIAFQVWCREKYHVVGQIFYHAGRSF